MEEQKVATPRSRRSESRAPESREFDARPPVVDWDRNPFNVPQALKDAYPDMVFMFARYSYLNSGEDRENIENKFDELGADIVPAAVSSQYIRSRRFARGMREAPDEWNESVRKRGHVLLWARREDYEAEREVYAKWSERQFNQSGTHDNLDVVVDDRQLKLVTGHAR